jgi:hypothetical protein
MAAEPMAAIVAAGMRGKRPMKPVGQVVVSLGPEHDMEVVGHETPGQDAHRDAGGRPPHELGKRRIIVGAVERLGTAVAAIDNVITITADSGASGAWHAAIVASGARQGKKNAPGIKLCPQLPQPREESAQNYGMFVDRHVQRLSVSHIAAREGLTVDQVSCRLYRMLTRLRGRVALYTGDKYERPRPRRRRGKPRE